MPLDEPWPHFLLPAALGSIYSRAVASNPFEPPRPVPKPVPANRMAPKAARRSLGLWLGLILFFLLIHFIFSPNKPPPANVAPPPVGAEHAGTYWGWLLPVVLYGGAFVLVMIWRAKLPPAVPDLNIDMRDSDAPRHANSVPPNDETSRAESDNPPADRLDICISGTNGERKVKLDLNDEGIHWQAAATAFLHGPEELHVAWSDLQSVRIHHGSLFWTWTAMVAAILYTFVWNPEVAIGAAGLAAILYFIEKKRAIGSFTFVTASHDLTLRSRQINRTMHARMAQAVRAKNQAAAPKSDDNDDKLQLLFINPFVQFKDALSSAESIYDKFIRPSSPNLDAIAKARGTLQWRMCALFSGTMLGTGPIAVGLGTALAANHSLGFLAGWIVAWFVGLLLFAKLLQPFTRFVGATLQE